MTPTLSVLITYHNERELLTECLRSLADQSPPPDEILVYDDASTYPAADYIPAAMPVRLIRGEVNIRPARGRNVLLREARSDYVHFHDADDLFLPGWGARVREAVAGGAGLVLTEIASYSQGRLVDAHVLGLAQLGDDPLAFALRGVIITSASVCRREAALAVGGFRETMRQSEDYDFHVRLIASGVPVSVIAEPLVRRENRPDSYSTREWGVAMADMAEALERFARDLPPRYHPLIAERAAGVGSVLYKRGERAAARRAFRLAAHMGPPTFAEQRRTYRVVARSLGPEAAELVTLIYRSAIPSGLRQLVARRGW